MSQPVHRRTIARGVAWTIPLVAVAVAAPAFAASRPPGATDPGTSCKCPGNGSPYTYHLDLAFTTGTTDNWTITLTNVTLAGELPPTPVLYSGSFIGGAGTIPFKFSGSKSAAKYTVTISYTATDTTTGETFTVNGFALGEVKFDVCGNGVVCP